MELRLLFMNNMYAHNFWYDIKEEVFEYDELKTHTIMQISIAKLGNVDEPLLFFLWVIDCAICLQRYIE